jgi:hypothetical protein
MNNISSLIMSKPLTRDTLSQAELWARKSAAVCGQEINKVGLKKSDKDQLDMCETTLAVALFNIASLREVWTVFYLLPFVWTDDLALHHRWRMIVRLLQTYFHEVWINHRGSV